MTRKLFATTLLLGAFAIPTFATAATSGFYVEQDAKTPITTTNATMSQLLGKRLRAVTGGDIL